MPAQQTINKDALNHLIAHLFKVKYNTRLTKTHIHKILFKLKLELPENNPLRDHLPFYWYNHGPFSGEVAAGITSLTRSGVLAGDVSEDYTLFELKKEPPPAEVEGLEEATETLERIVRNVNFFHFKPFIDEIYREHAPYTFMPLFKLDFLSALQDYFERISSGQQTFDTYTGIHTEVDRLEDLLYECEAETPSDELFTPFNKSFSTLVTAASRVFDHIRENSEHTFLVETLGHTANTAWETFAKGIRILHHDNYYDNEVEHWKREYRESLSFLSTHVEYFDKYVLAEIKVNRLHPSFSETSRNILSSVVEGYLSWKENL